MKKTVVFLLLLVLCLAMASCADNNPIGDQTQAEETAISEKAQNGNAEDLAAALPVKGVSRLRVSGVTQASYESEYDLYISIWSLMRFGEWIPAIGEFASPNHMVLEFTYGEDMVVSFTLYENGHASYMDSFYKTPAYAYDDVLTSLQKADGSYIFDLKGLDTLFKSKYFRFSYNGDDFYIANKDATDLKSVLGVEDWVATQENPAKEGDAVVWIAGESGYDLYIYPERDFAVVSSVNYSYGFWMPEQALENFMAKWNDYKAAGTGFPY